MGLKIEFEDPRLERLYREPLFTGGYTPQLVQAYRKRMCSIAHAQDERDLYAMKSNHFEKLKGARSDQRSLRLNDQWRLIVRLEGDHPDKRLVIIAIEDYH